MTFDEWWESKPNVPFLAPETKGWAREAWDAAIQAEREACAKIAECFEPDQKLDHVEYASRAIRARSTP